MNCIGYADVNKVGSAVLFSTLHTSKKTCMDANSLLVAVAVGCSPYCCLAFGMDHVEQWRWRTGAGWGKTDNKP